MSYDPTRHNRQSIRLSGYDYSQVGAYFITIVTHRRVLLFGEVSNGAVILNEAGCIVRDEWLKAPAIRLGLELGPFVIMPNHLHGIVIIANREPAISQVQPMTMTPSSPRGPRPNAIGAVLACFKAAATRRINRWRDTPGAAVWQRNNYEHVIRSEASYARIAAYIRNNPAHWPDDCDN